MPTRLADLLHAHLKQRHFPEAMISSLVADFEKALEQGRALLLVDGLDEIPNSEGRIEFSRLLASIAGRFPNSPIVITSRVVGFQAVRDELAAKFDHLMVGPLDRAAKRSFIERWTGLIGWDPAKAEGLIHQVCHNRVTAKLTENIFLLAMVAQIQVLEDKLPGRRVDIYRRAVQLMIQRRRPFAGPALSANELFPHLEFLAYAMRKKGVQRCGEGQVVEAFRELRRLEPGEPVLLTRSPDELLRACIDSLGILNVAGTETDSRGFDRRIIQFFHQSFQEYFAGQAIIHGHDAAGPAGAVARLRDLLATIEIREREVVIQGEYKIREPVIADYWQEAVRLGIADLTPDEADDAILMLLPGPATPPGEVRPRAVFALQCLADEPKVSHETISAVFEAAIHSLEDGDGFGNKLHTWMDSAIAAVLESAFGKRFQDRLHEDYLQSRGEPRRRIGSSLVVRSIDKNLPINPENAGAMLVEVTRGISSPEPTERVRTALKLMDRCFKTGGKLGFLTPPQQEVLTDVLVSALGKDEATDGAILWAFRWLTGAALRSIGNLLTRRGRPKPNPEIVLLDSPTVRKIEEALRRPGQDPYTFIDGCLVLTREKDLDIVNQQCDWIYELAMIADGGRPRRTIPGPRPTGRSASVEWIVKFLDESQPIPVARRAAQTLGSFGVYLPEMVQPLRSLFKAPEVHNDDRDEALVYLALIGTPEVAQILVEAANTPPIGDNDYLSIRGLFGLILLDDVDLLAKQLREALPHSDQNAYAYALAGSRDPRGLELLKQLRDHLNKNVSTSAHLAIARSWAADAS